MDCIREAENYLRYYRELHQSLKHADRMISKLKWQTAPKKVGAAVNDETGVRADKPVNTLNQLYQLQKWMEIKERTECAIQEVDEALEVICIDPGCERYKELLVLFFSEKKDRNEIADIMGYSHKQSVYEMKNRAIRKLAVALFGIVAWRGLT